MVKAGVLFLKTLSGGVLMDVHADRFIALSPLSAGIWSDVSSGLATSDVVDRIGSAKGISQDSARTLLASQLQKWERAQLLSVNHPLSALPQPKLPKICRSQPISADVMDAPVVPRLILSLHLTEMKYRRALAKVGLATTLGMLQSESSSPAQDRASALRRTVRSYHVLRRHFRRGVEARDCLVRSLALAAVLRRQGVDSDLCIGVIDLPFSSHAWVEADGHLIDDTPDMCERYSIIARF